jgi:hypothetical protein
VHLNFLDFVAHIENKELPAIQSWISSSLWNAHSWRQEALQRIELAERDIGYTAYGMMKI